MPLCLYLPTAPLSSLSADSWQLALFTFPPFCCTQAQPTSEGRVALAAINEKVTALVDAVALAKSIVRANSDVSRQMAPLQKLAEKVTRAPTSNNQ